MSLVHREWLEKQWDPEFFNSTYRDQAKVMGVSCQTIYAWVKAEKPAFWERIKNYFRENSHREMAKVDVTLLRKALSGDVAAIKLWKESIEGWSPKQINENFNRGGDLEGLTDEELLEKSLESIPAETLAKVLSKKGLGAPTVAPEEAKKAENGAG